MNRRIGWQTVSFMQIRLEPVLRLLRHLLYVNLTACQGQCQISKEPVVACIAARQERRVGSLEDVEDDFPLRVEKEQI